jgi:S1-C subfamily serine protease
MCPIRALAFALAFLSLPAAAAVTTLTPQAQIEALTQAHAAVVGVEVQATEGARSADTLGRARAGSGVVIGADGLVLTIGYLMLEAQTIQVVTQEGRSVPARAVAYDLATGFGLVRTLLPLRGVRPAPLGSVRDLAEGDTLMAAVGGAQGDVAMSRLVSRRPFTGYWEYHIESAVFTSPPIGNHSGAPLFNSRGELLGIGSLFVGDALGDGRRLPGNMFVPVDLLRPILAELEKSGTTRASRRPWLGISSQEQGGRVQVVRVNAESPAEAAGVEAGDVLLAIDGVRIDSLATFYKKLWDRPEPDAEVQLTILQGSNIRQLTLKAVDRMSVIRKPGGI